MLVLVLLLVVMMVVVMLGRKFPQFYISQLPIDRSAAVTGMIPAIGPQNGRVFILLVLF